MKSAMPMQRSRPRYSSTPAIFTVVLFGIAALIIQRQSLLNIATANLYFPALQKVASIFEHELVLYRGTVFRVAAAGPHSFQMLDNNIFRFEVHKGDRYSSPSWTDADNVERSEMGEISRHLLSSIDGHFHASYQFMIEPGPRNTAQWLVTGQLFGGGTPPFEIKFMDNDNMAVVIKHGSRTSPIERTVYLDPANIERGRWYDMQIDVKLGADSTSGHAYVWRDGIMIVNYNDKIGYVEQTHAHWEIGVYRKSPPGGESFAINYKSLNIIYGVDGHSDSAATVSSP